MDEPTHEAVKEIMFQDFTDRNSKDLGPARLNSLREQLTRLGVHGFMVPREDEYMGEYVPACNERLQWLTGFNGSAGIAVILPDRAALFVDGRYTVQAPQQVDTSAFEIIHSADMRPSEWLEKHLKPDHVLAIDPQLHTQSSFKLIEKAVSKVGAKINCLENNPVDAVWLGRPAQPSSTITIQPETLTGKNHRTKCSELADNLKRQDLDAVIIAQPENIAWLLNIRGQDVPHTPFVLSYGIMHSSGVFDWYLPTDRLNPSLTEHLGENVNICEPAQLKQNLMAMTDSKIGMDPGATPHWFYRCLDAATISSIADPCALPKACKTTEEVNATRIAHERDGVALCRFLHWLDTTSGDGSVTEIQAAKQLEAFRADSPELLDLSFDTISGSGPNGAIVHYRVNETTNRNLLPGELFLLDSGGQYRDGTTDVTRTILIGETPHSNREIECFTRVLKGHIALAQAMFPIGTNGMQLDTLARAPLWEVGLDFDHGTGHGVGSYLSVHEGPQRISKGGTVAMQPGMILSNEPGYYLTDAFGIRIENLMVVREPIKTSPMERPMLSFETLTLAPMDRRLIDIELLDPAEINWLNEYHQRIRETIADRLPDNAKQWLMRQTEPI
jgi:Xaa-Pro aminopeptidase